MGTLSSYSAPPLKLHVSVEGLGPDGRLPSSCAFCPPAATAPRYHNISPAVSWSPGPARTRSYALLMADLDGVVDLSFLKSPDIAIPVDAERTTYFHWVLIDIPR